MVTIWSELDSQLLCRDCFIKIGKVTQALKPTLEGDSKVIEASRRVRVTIWGETDRLLLYRDRIVEIGNVTQALKPTK
jgi:hypothetical protein